MYPKTHLSSILLLPCFHVGGVNDPNLIIWKVLSTVNRMEMEFGGIYLFG